jgi:hypothetical protein
MSPRGVKLLGNPEGLAEFQFRHALDHCGDCRDYHAVWAYRRLSRTIAGIESTADLVGRLLREVVASGGTVLIAGAADAGLLALALDATEGLSPTIHVADRCPTPLAVCRRYAEARGVAIVTHEVDFSRAMPSVRYDAVLADCVLQFVPREFHLDVLRGLRDAMAPNGSLVLAERLRSVLPAGAPHQYRLSAVVDALAAQGIRLPEDASSFAGRLNRMLDSQRRRVALCAATTDIASNLAEAGFRLWDLNTEQTVTVPGGDSVRMKIVVASPART